MGDDCARRVHLQVRLDGRRGPRADATARRPHRHRRQVPRRRQALRRASSMPTAPAHGSSCRSPTRRSPAMRRYAFADQADVAGQRAPRRPTRSARRRWTARSGAPCIPTTGEVYYTLTNNSNRKRRADRHVAAALDAANPRAYTDTSGGAPRRSRATSTATSSAWPRPAASAAATHLHVGRVPLRRRGRRGPRRWSTCPALTADQDFSSPDGLWFSRAHRHVLDPDRRRRLHRRHQLHDAGRRAGHGGGRREEDAELHARRRQHAGGGHAVSARSRRPTRCKRFLVGPVDCEITGCTETPDGKALFVNIQHPGETISAANVADPTKYLSHWPGNAGYGAGGAKARPRSATDRHHEERRRAHRHLTTARRWGRCRPRCGRRFYAGERSSDRSCRRR